MTHERMERLVFLHLLRYDIYLHLNILPFFDDVLPKIWFWLPTILLLLGQYDHQTTYHRKLSLTSLRDLDYRSNIPVVQIYLSGANHKPK